jgi:hypothetical protein
MTSIEELEREVEATAFIRKRQKKEGVNLVSEHN